jgi:hypothetical protein
MKKKVLLAMLLTIFTSLIIGFYSGLRLGIDNINQSHRLMTAKLASYNLENSSLTPQMREYLKVLLYSSLTDLDNGDLSDHKIDYGPINRDALMGVNATKEPVDEIQVYKNAMAIHNQKNQ